MDLPDESNQKEKRRERINYNQSVLVGKSRNPWSQRVIPNFYLRPTYLRLFQPPNFGRTQLQNFNEQQQEGSQNIRQPPKKCNIPDPPEKIGNGDFSVSASKRDLTLRTSWSSKTLGNRLDSLKEYPRQKRRPITS